MATRPVFSITDKASTTPGVAGAALAAEYATQAYPESSNKRFRFTMRPANNAATTGATAAELFIDGVQGFRFRLAERSTCMMRLIGSYNCSVAGSNVGFEIALAATNVGGVITILANSSNIKYPNAAVAAIAVTSDNPTQSLVFTFTGVAGDANGQVELRCVELSEITDLG